MEKQIILRAWDGANKVMIQPFHYWTVYSENVTETREHFPNSGTGFWIKDVMLFTGLKDKNGKEIYEGDIIKYTEHHKYLLQSFNAEVRYVQSYAGFGYLKLGLNESGYNHVVIHSFSEHDELTTDVLPYLEVIGNIYENPELLNDEE